MKIVVSGPLQCGKSSYVKYFDKNSMNIQAIGKENRYYTVGLDLGSLKLNGFIISLFGTPGLLRFKTMRDIIVGGSDGIIFIFDAIRPEKDKEAIIMLNSIRKLLPPNTPIVYLANKQDIEGARAPEVIKKQNNLSEGCKIFPASTKIGLNVRESMVYLVNEIFDSYKELLEILRNYETDIRGLAEKLNKNKEQIRDFLNHLELKRFIYIDRINKTFQVKKGLKNIV